MIHHPPAQGISHAPAFLPGAVGSYAGGAFTLASLPNLFALWRASDSALGVADAPVTDGEVYTLADLSGNGINLTAPSSTFRPSRDSDGGPGGIPVLTFLADAMRTASAFATLTNFTVIYLGRIRSTGFSSAERMYSGDGSPVFSNRRNALTGSTGTHTLDATSGGSGNMTIPADEWMLHVGECIGGAGRWMLSGNQIRPMIGSPTAYQIDNFAIGDHPANAALCCDQDVVELALVEGALDWATIRRVRDYAASTLGIAVTSYSFEDTFNRADTVDNTIGLSSSGHAWEGSSAATRILSNTLTLVSPWTTSYSWPQIALPPMAFGCDYTTRDLGGGTQPVGALLIAKARQSLNSLVHIVWGINGWTLEQYLFTGVVAQNLVHTRSYATPYLAGSLDVSVDWEGGTLTITGADGVSVVCDWDGADTSEPLINYKTPYLAFQIGASVPGVVIQYDRVWAR